VCGAEQARAHSRPSYGWKQPTRYELVAEIRNQFTVGKYSKVGGPDALHFRAGPTCLADSSSPGVSRPIDLAPKPHEEIARVVIRLNFRRKVPQALVFGVMGGERHAPMPCGASAIGAHELQTRLGCAALGQSFQRAEIARPMGMCSFASASRA